MGKRRTANPRPSRPVETLHGASPDAVLDLHGFDRVRALRRLNDLLSTWERSGRPAVLRIVTGKGNRSEDGPVLLDAVGDELRRHLGERVSEMVLDAGGGGWLVRTGGDR